MQQQADTDISKADRPVRLGGKAPASLLMMKSTVVALVRHKGTKLGILEKTHNVSLPVPDVRLNYCLTRRLL